METKKKAMKAVRGPRNPNGIGYQWSFVEDKDTKTVTKAADPRLPSKVKQKGYRATPKAEDKE